MIDVRHDSGIRPRRRRRHQYLMGRLRPPHACGRWHDRIPRELAARFEAAGRTVNPATTSAGSMWRMGRSSRFRHDPGVEREPGLALPLPAPRRSPPPPVINGSSWRRLFGSVAGYPATKLYAGTTDRGGATAPTLRPACGRRPTCRTGSSSTSTLARPAAMLAAFTTLATASRRGARRRSEQGRAASAELSKPCPVAPDHPSRAAVPMPSAQPSSTGRRPARGRLVLGGQAPIR